jgi:hypothetical protein
MDALADKVRHHGQSGAKLSPLTKYFASTSPVGCSSRSRRQEQEAVAGPAEVAGAVATTAAGQAKVTGAAARPAELQP